MSCVSLYFHIPFCTKKCPYCHFYVLPNREDLKQNLLAALKLEWEKNLPLLADKTIVSIYFGGGTPSLFGPKAIAEVLSWIRSSCIVTPTCEITLEANPEEGANLAAFKNVGINRMSLGVQSLSEDTLHVLGRRHTQENIHTTLYVLHKAGLENLSIDLMYDVPRMNCESWQKTLDQVKELPIKHLSLYNLTFEPQTVFYKKRNELLPQVPTPEKSLAHLNAAITTLERIGLKRYEISAFAQEGYTSVHNTGYWTGRPFLGFGPSAFSYWEGKRFRNVCDLKRYASALELGSSPVDFEEKLPYPNNLSELLAVQLRLLEGVHLHKFHMKHGTLPDTLKISLEKLSQKGWLSFEGEQITLTEQGLLFYDSVASEIV